jgi:Family of unknown function (DUF5675)
MNLTLKRYKTLDGTTIGRLYNGASFICYTLEDAVREKKIYGETAIPAGTYNIDITMSPRFGVMLPLLLNVPNYVGVRIHPGNTKRDTEGCILPGMTVSHDSQTVYNSRIAFGKIMDLLKQAQKKGELLSITITNHEET